MAEVISKHQYVYGNACCTCGDIWYDHRLMPSQLQIEHFLHIEKGLIDAGYGRITPSVTEWGAGFAETGEIYNAYRTQREAESYVRSMNEVDAGMVVMAREYTPEVSTDWRVV
jgi:hypothetical protein